MAIARRPSTSHLSTRARRLIDDADQGGSPLPPRPTAALPGTPEKERVIRQRVKGGYNVRHPDDLTIEDAKALGYTCTTDANGAIQWRRPVSEAQRRELILSALAARRKGE